MSSNEHIIELNGKRYNAITGKMITGKPSKTAVETIKKASLDGFARAVKPILRSGNMVPAHQTEKSKTLMRNTVKPPQSKPQNEMAKPKYTSRINKSPSVVSPIKLSKAQSIKKSSLVRRFSEMAPSNIDRFSSETNKKASTRVQAVAVAVAVKSDPVALGLAKADSHKQQKPKKMHASTRMAKKLHISPKTLSISSLVIAVIVIGGFFASQNMSNISMRIASSRSGIKGSIPSYQPAGFGLKGGISYSPGQIELGYNSNSDNRNFKIIQKTSSWNSETLAENYEPLKNNVAYQTIPVKGKTVYLFEGSNATWVDGGIWYRIEGNSKLNSDQLLNIANSL